MVGLVMFTASNCKFCGPMKDILYQVIDDYEDNSIEVTTIQVNESSKNMDIARQWGVQGVPYFIIVKNREVVEKWAGTCTKQELEERLDRHLDKTNDSKEIALRV